MLALRQLDFRSSFPTQKLKIAHGEAVCGVLDFLTSKLLETRAFQWNSPIYHDADLVSFYFQQYYYLHIYDFDFSVGTRGN